MSTTPTSLDTIFKAYDVRGVYPDQLDESVARLVGDAFVSFTGASRVLVGRDACPSSGPLTEAFFEGATAAGAGRRRPRAGLHRPRLLRVRVPPTPAARCSRPATRCRTTAEYAASSCAAGAGGVDRARRR